MIILTVCMGSLFHINGAEEMIACSNEFLNKEDRQVKVELKGSLCMEHYGEL